LTSRSGFNRNELSPVRMFAQALTAWRDGSVQDNSLLTAPMYEMRVTSQQKHSYQARRRRG
jgi:hypothetical protein